MDDIWIGRTARERGPLSSGWYRVVVLESGSRVTHHDFLKLEAARLYADDAASEDDSDPAPVAYVLDGEFNIVDRGMHYSLRSQGGVT